MKAKNYVFFVELPTMQDEFYFHAEQVEMKKPPIANQELDENKILYVYENNGELSFKDYKKQSAQLILETIKEYEAYEGYEGREEKFFYHYHNLMEISLVLSGEGYYFVEGKAIKVKKGSVILLNKLVPHAWCADEEHAPVQITCTFYPTLLMGEEIEKKENIGLKELFNQMTYIFMDGEKNEQYSQLLGRIYEEYKEKSLGYQQIIKYFLLILFHYVVRCYPTQKEKKKRTSHADIEQAIQYMKTNFHNNITLEQAAGHVYMHPNYFSSVFKKKCGVSFADYMNLLKVSMATELMQSTELGIEEIAEQSGFTSLSNFYRVFKKIHQVSPAKYMKQM